MALSAPASTAQRGALRWAGWPGWRELPREARDTLFLLAVIGWTVLPHAAHLPAWCGWLTLAVLLWRARLAVRGAALPGRWVLVAVLIVAAGLTLMSYRTLLGKEPGVTLLVALMALKTLELRARRDAFVVFFLGFFIVLTHFLYSQSLAVALAMLVSVWGLLTALVLAHMPVGQPSLRQAGFLAARTAALGAPIMVLMFVLFPRVGPLWGVPSDGAAGTGLSNRMRMGSLAEIALDDSIALRIRFEGAAPAPQAMYLRGPVLARFDGTEWRPLVPNFASGFAAGAALRTASGAELRVTGPALPYEITLEPQRLTVLPTLEATPEAPLVEGNAQGHVAMPTDDLQWVVARPLYERVRYRAAAYPRFQHGPLAPTPGLRDYLELPPAHNPRTLEWAAALRRDPAHAQADARSLARTLMQHIRTQGYSYTLAPGVYLGSDAVDQFWLDRKEGFCEHFAAAFVVLMRALDVPARIVTGYQGADLAPVDGFFVVRQSSAHAWAEYWQEGAGWIRADPTAAVAPERIDRSRQLRPPPGLVAQMLGEANPELLASLRAGWELLNNRWNQWVMNYSRTQQFDLLKSLGFRSPQWEDLALLSIWTVCLLALGGAAWAWWDRRRIDPWQRQMLALRAALQRAGIAAAPHEAAGTLARRVRSRFGAAGEALALLLETLERQRYDVGARVRPDRALTRQSVQLARALATRAAPQPS